MIICVLFCREDVYKEDDDEKKMRTFSSSSSVCKLFACKKVRESAPPVVFWRLLKKKNCFCVRKKLNFESKN